MEEDIYKELLERAKRGKPQMKDPQLFKENVMREIEPHPKRLGLHQFLRVAASIILIFSVSSYIWMEIYVWESRLAIEQKVKPESTHRNSEWQCRQRVNEFMATLMNTGVLTSHSTGLMINKTNMELLKDEHADLYKTVEEILARVKQFKPVDYYAFQAGEDVRLTAWQLRREYYFCEWINK
ncbi:hypothetical protein [Carboxylicivirga marina]|uniref:hypothetical protein n=1 Tax=Carboxylicivirga marina TaxID=2800988 RepID=UPI002594DF8F|nr:hypothetical protein [uncultured Carboxylicivirga sp.]